MPHSMNILPISRRLFWSIIGGTCFVGWPLISSIKNPSWTDKSHRPERTIIVTGATGVLGQSTALCLAQRKCRVIMACRDMDKCKALRREIILETKNKSVVCRHLDLEDIDSINEFAEEMIKNEPHIDVIINNAATKTNETRVLTKYGIEKHWFVNFLAPYLLTLKLLGKLEESAKITNDSRVVNVIGNPKKSWHIDLTDINFDKRAYTNRNAYNQSKLALAYFSILLEKSNRAKRNQVYVFGTSPSSHNILPGLGHETSWRSAFTNLFWEWSHQNAVRCIQRTLKCALDPKLVRQEMSGKLYNYWLNALGSNDGWGVAALNEEKAKLTWNVAADMLLSANESPPAAPNKSAKQTGQQSGAGVQVKVQGNSKASGVDESA